MKEEAKNVKQDIEIAVLAKEVEHMGKSVETLNLSMSEKIKTLTEVVRSFIEIADKKVDRDTYLADKLAQGTEFVKIQERVAKIEEKQKIDAVQENAIKDDRKKIFGVSQASLSFAISILTLISLGAAVIGLFANK